MQLLLFHVSSIDGHLVASTSQLLLKMFLRGLYVEFRAVACWVSISEGLGNSVVGDSTLNILEQTAFSKVARHCVFPPAEGSQFFHLCQHFLRVLGTELRPSSIPGRCSIVEPRPQPLTGWLGGRGEGKLSTAASHPALFLLLLLRRGLLSHMNALAEDPTLWCTHQVTQDL